jgi:hypothetical protein
MKRNGDSWKSSTNFRTRCSDRKHLTTKRIDDRKVKWETVETRAVRRPRLESSAWYRYLPQTTNALQIIPPKMLFSGAASTFRSKMTNDPISVCFTAVTAVCKPLRHAIHYYNRGLDTATVLFHYSITGNDQHLKCSSDYFTWVRSRNYHYLSLME